jgi:hypothetical protein
MPRPVISVDTIGRLQRTARSHESLADRLNTDEQLLLVLDRHDEMLDMLPDDVQLDSTPADRDNDPDPYGMTAAGTARQPTSDLSDLVQQP